MDGTTGMAEFVSIGEIAETTIHLLSLNLSSTAHHGASSGSRPKQGDPVEQLVLQQARDYLHLVREGFMLSMRTSPSTDIAELRFLLDRVLTDWNQLSRELGLDDT